MLLLFKIKRLKMKSIFLLFLSFFLLTTNAIANEKEVLLTITSKDKIILLTRKDLQRFNQTTIKQVTFWTKGETSFTGPLLRDILDKYELKGKNFVASAYNDYKVTIPTKDFYDYDVIIASHVNNKELTVRSKGPLWLMYPWGENGELDQKTYYSRAIWQMTKANIDD